jgi:hypothetical protein
MPVKQAHWAHTKLTTVRDVAMPTILFIIALISILTQFVQCATLAGLALTMNFPEANRAVVLTISFTPSQAITSGPNAGIAITLVGGPFNLNAGAISTTCDVPLGYDNTPQCSVTISPSGSTPQVLVVKLTAGTYVTGNAVQFRIFQFGTSSFARMGRRDVRAGTSNDLTADPVIVIDSTTTGTFPGLSWMNDFSMSFSSSKKSTNTTATISFSPSSGIRTGEVGSNTKTALILPWGINSGISFNSGGASVCRVIAGFEPYRFSPQDQPACSVLLESIIPQTGTPYLQTSIWFTAGIYPKGNIVSVTITNFRTPTEAKPSTTAIMVLQRVQGQVVDSGGGDSGSAVFPAISSGSLQNLEIKLSDPSKDIVTSTTVSISFTPTQAITPGLNAGIAITLLGGTVALNSGGQSSECRVIAGYDNSPQCSVTISPSGSTPQVLVVTLTAGTYVTGSAVQFQITQFGNPMRAQDRQQNVAAGTSNDFTLSPEVIVDSTNTGSFSGISWLSNLAINLASVEVSTTTLMTVSFTPTESMIHQGRVLTIELPSVVGMAVNSGGTSVCTVSHPSVIPARSCAAVFSSAPNKLQLTFLATYPRDEIVTVTVTNVLAPGDSRQATDPAPPLNGGINQLALRACHSPTNAPNSCELTTISGFFPQIRASINLRIELASAVKATSTTATISFTPTQAISTSSGNAGIAITLSGAGIAVDLSNACTVTAPSPGTCTARFANSVLTVLLTGGSAYASFASVTLTVTKFTTPTNGQMQLTNVAAGTSNDFSSSTVAVIDTTITGSFPGISATPPVPPPTPTPSTPAPTAAPGGSSNAQADGGNAALSGGSVAGIVIGSIAGVAIIGIASWMGYKRFQTTRSPNGNIVSNSV